MGRLRLLHLEVTPVFADDDGTYLTTIPGVPFVVQDAEVAGFSQKWAEEFTVLQERHAQAQQASSIASDSLGKSVDKPAK